jgi:competence protein ComEA
VARAGFALDGLSTRALAELAVTGGSSANPAGIGAPQGALARVSQAGSPSPSRANSPPSSPAALPCPCAPSPENERGLSASARASPGAGAAASEARVVLNRASAAELQRLPGVGAKRAEAILQLRQRLGRFRKPSDLLRVKGIGPRTLERMSPYLVLD